MSVKRICIDKVSVPFRGYLYFNPIGYVIGFSPPYCFRPLSGLSLFQCQSPGGGARFNHRFRPLSGLSLFQLVDELIEDTEGDMFPSPFGVISSSMGIRMYEEITGSMGFRPLSGLSLVQ